MASMDFMAMRRKVMGEDQVLAGQRQAEAQARARPVAKWLNLLCEEEVPESLRRKVAARGGKTGMKLRHRWNRCSTGCLKWTSV